MTEQKERLTLCAEGILAVATSAVRESFLSMFSEALPVWLAPVLGRAARSCSRRSLMTACGGVALALVSHFVRTDINLTYILSCHFALRRENQPYPPGIK
jgi:hypothetical protein